MGRSPCCDKTGVKRGKWTAEEDEKLINYIKANGEGSWRSLPKNAGLLRCGKSCRLRWMNYLRADVKRGNFTLEEEETIVKLHKTMGNKWSSIASHLPGRTDNEIKNYWNTNLSRTLYRFRSFGESMVTSKGSVKNKKNTDSYLSRRIESDKNPNSREQKRARIEEKDPHKLPDGTVACCDLLVSEECTSAFTMSPKGGETDMPGQCDELDDDLLMLLKQFEESWATDQTENFLINDGIDKVLIDMNSATTSQEMECGTWTDAGNIYGCLSPTVSYFNNEKICWDVDELSIWSEEEYMSIWS